MLLNVITIPAQQCCGPFHAVSKSNWLVSMFLWIKKTVMMTIQNLLRHAQGHTNPMRMNAQFRQKL